MMEDFQREVGEWGSRTFPESTPLTIAKHLGEEAAEVLAAVDYDRDFQTDETLDDVKSEAAGVMLLLLHLSHRLGFDLETATRDEFERIKGRKWAFDPEKGYSRHVEVEG